MAVVMSASSWNQTPGSSLRQSLAFTPPLTMGISTESPVRLSVIVMLSAMSWAFPRAHVCGAGCCPARTNLQRAGVVASRRQVLALRRQDVEGGAELAPGVGRVD